MKTRTKIKVPVLKPRNPLVIPPNRIHTDKRKKTKHKRPLVED
jgi:hypothetical protein